jgi:hypothetical protein
MVVIVVSSITEHALYFIQPKYEHRVKYWLTAVLMETDLILSAL